MAHLTGGRTRGAGFENLVLEQREIFNVQDPGWIDYERDLDREKLAAKHTEFVRATLIPSLASASVFDRAEGRQRFINAPAMSLRRGWSRSRRRSSCSHRRSFWRRWRINGRHHDSPRKNRRRLPIRASARDLAAPAANGRRMCHAWYP